MAHFFSNQRLRRRWFFYAGFAEGCRFRRMLTGAILTVLLLVTTAQFFGAEGSETALPQRRYPLPSRLEAVLEQQWLGPTQVGGDYFDQITPSTRGYLLWATWPVQVFLEPSRAAPGSAEARRQAQWQAAAQGAIADWSRYVPLEFTPDRDQAQIVILRRQPPLRWEKGQLSPARHAETRFRIMADQDSQGRPCLKHQQTLSVGDHQGPVQLQGTLRHELGHALGLWGHSPDPGDALYAGQVSEPPAISQRDLNTLGKLYGQPTQLGCLVGLPETAHGS